MGANDNVVTITIQTVDESSGAISNVETKLAGLGATAAAASAAASSKVKEFSGTLQQASVAGAQVTTSMHYMGSVGTGAISEASAAAHGLQGHMREVSGMAHEAGLNMGWSMRQLIAESPAAMAALNAISSAFIGIAVVGIFVQAIEGLHALWEKWFDVTKAVEAYQTKAGDAAQQKLFDTASLETALSLLRQANDEVDRLDRQKKAAGADKRGGGLLQWVGGVPATNQLAPLASMGSSQWASYLLAGAPARASGTLSGTTYTSGNDEQAAQAQQNLATAEQRTDELHHESALQRQKVQEAYNSTALTGYAKTAAAANDEIATAQIQLAYTKQREQSLQKITEATLALQKAQHVPEDQQIKVYHANPNAGNDVYDRAVALATAKESGANVAASRSEQEQIISMQNAAIDAGARGEALYSEQRQQAIDLVARKYEHAEISKRGMLAETAALDMKFHNEQMKRLDEEH